MRSLRARLTLSDLQVLILLGTAMLVLHTVTNGQYGWHRDELAVLDDARHLDWGYVAYPPFTPFVARAALVLFGPSLAGVRLFAALSQSIAMVLTGLIARELGGSRPAQVIAAVAAAISPISLLMGALFQYVSFDYMWWVVIAYFMVRLLKSGDPRWWPAIGLAIGLGMMTKYTMAFLVAGIAAGILLTPARRQLASPWLWGGVVIAVLISIPNLLWQVRHGFISLDFLNAIHRRDVEIGRADGFLLQQLYVSANPFVLPLWAAGLYFYFFSPRGVRYRTLAWMYAVPLALFFTARGRFYYVAPAYPMLIAAGTVAACGWLSSLPGRVVRIARASTWVALTAGALLAGALMLPIAPVNSAWWHLTSRVHDNFTEQIGWQELVRSVADVYAALPKNERLRTGILAGNYGEAGAIDLFGPAFGLPRAISGTNSYWLRGYGDPPPETLIVVGFSSRFLEEHFGSCELAGQIRNRYGIENEETRIHRNIFVCSGLRQPWPEFWKSLLHFG